MQSAIGQRDIPWTRLVLRNVPKVQFMAESSISGRRHSATTASSAAAEERASVPWAHQRNYYYRVVLRY